MLDIYDLVTFTNSTIGTVNISERKSGTERTKKRKKRELVFSSPSGGATGNDGFFQSYDNILQTDTWHDQMTILYYEIHSFRIIYVPGCNDMLPTSQSELPLPNTGRCMVAESSEFDLTLSKAHRAHFFQLEIRKKSGTF